LIMFSKGSRYRNLSESVFLTAAGERIRGKALRVIPAPESNVLHTVKGGDRLDLLAYKYYGDTTKWWQISDANPERPFPLDLLETTPLAEELFTLIHANFAVRYDHLIIALENIGTVRNDAVNYFELQETMETSAPPQVVTPSFLDEKIMVVYPPAERDAVLTAIEAHKFHRLGSFSFPQGTDLVEIFTIDDPAVKANWDLLVANLSETPGVVEVESSIAERTLSLVYNTDTVTQESLVGLMKEQGFVVETAPRSMRPMRQTS
jgi:hypothetical protein